MMLAPGFIFALALLAPPPAPAPARATGASTPSDGAVTEAPQGAEVPVVEAARLREEARRAYALRDFATAIERLDHAYRLTGETALLYELGDAHARYYELDHNVDHLRRARSFFRTHARRQEVAGLPPGDSWERVAALSKRIALLEPGDAAASAPSCPRCPPAPPCPERQVVESTPTSTRSPAPAPFDDGPRPGDRRVEAGVGLLAGGGALLVPGAILGVSYLVEGTRLRGELDGRRAALEACASGCQAIEGEIAALQARGALVNRLAGAGIGLAITGVVLGATGAGLVVSGRRKAQAELALAPARGGLSLVGRF